MTPAERLAALLCAPHRQETDSGLSLGLASAERFLEAVARSGEPSEVEPWYREARLILSRRVVTVGQ